ncbi:hypothetical protein GCM10023405_48680 [Streptomonospora salina]
MAAHPRERRRKPVRTHDEYRPRRHPRLFRRDGRDACASNAPPALLGYQGLLLLPGGCGSRYGPVSRPLKAKTPHWRTGTDIHLIAHKA